MRQKEIGQNANQIVAVSIITSNATCAERITMDLKIALFVISATKKVRFTMIANWFDHDGQEVESGQYSPVTKSLYRAAVDAARMFGGEVGLVNSNSGWAVVKVGDKRVVIGQ